MKSIIDAAVARSRPILLILALVLTAVPAWAELQRIRFAVPNRGTSFFGLIAAQDQGFFRAEGLDSQLIAVTPSALQRQSGP